MSLVRKDPHIPLARDPRVESRKKGCVIMRITDDMTRSMACPECGGYTGVADSRPYGDDLSAIHRRRKCLRCGHRFSTLETIVELPRRDAFAKMNKADAEILLLYAANGMNASKTDRQLHKTVTYYHLKRVQNITGKNPKDPVELKELLPMAERIFKEEE